MFDVIMNFKTYLQKHCRLTDADVVNYLGQLPLIFEQMNISTVEDIDEEKVEKVWQNKRWQVTEDGIQISESAENGYLAALKLLLEFLHKSGRITGHSLTDAIHIQASKPERIRGLTPEETQRLREFLVFNVSNDTQRRETALVFFVMATGSTVQSALSLNVHESGKILPESESQKSGDFRWIDGMLTVRLQNENDEPFECEVPEEVTHFLNFYLENRKHHHRILFLSDARRNGPGRLSGRVAEKIAERVLQRAGIPCLEGQAITLIRSNALKKNPQLQTNKRIIISLREAENEEKYQDAPLKMRVA